MRYDSRHHCFITSNTIKLKTDSFYYLLFTFTAFCFHTSEHYCTIVGKRQQFNVQNVKKLVFVLGTKEEKDIKYMTYIMYTTESLYPSPPTSRCCDEDH